MGSRAFVYVILGGGVAAGYAALEFTKRGVNPGELCIISEEHVAPYERPALSKGFLLPKDPARLPDFHTCVGEKEEKLTPEWYKEHGIELLLGTRVSSADLGQKTLYTGSGETISYKFLIVATGAQALKLTDLGVKDSDAANVCYLRNLDDATRLVNVMQRCAGRNAVVIGGGYIGMECAAALVTNRVKVTMVFPGKHCMNRLFTPEIADFYEKHYESKGVKFIKEDAVMSFENPRGKVTAVTLRSGTRVPTDMVVVGVGARANTSLFEGKLRLEKGGIKVNGLMQTSDRSVYAVGDVAAFPVKLFGGEIRRLEHVDCARKTARHAVAAIMDPWPWRTGDIDYLPFFYSRVFTLSWEFYGDNRGEVVHYGDPSSMRFGAYWVDNSCLVGAFLEGGNRDEFEAIAKVIRMKVTVQDLSELEQSGLEFALQASKRSPPATDAVERMNYAWDTRVAACLAVLIVAFAYWYVVR